jgi:hypothetical protein
MTDDSIASLLGDQAWQRLVAAFGGTTITLPKKQLESSQSFTELKRVLGCDLAERLRLRHAGEKLYIPMGIGNDRIRRDAEIAARLALGESPSSIARSFRVVTRISVRQVLRIAAGVVKVSSSN